MIGGIIGDIVGSIYEFNNIKTKDFPLFSRGVGFTDDTVMLVATMNSILVDCSFGESYTYFYQKYPGKGYGMKFTLWCESNLKDNKINPGYNSYGNGSAMRVAPIGYLYNTIEETLEKAKETAEYSHNHIEGIKGAQAVAISIYFLRNGKGKKYIKEYIEKEFNYNLSRDIDELRKIYKYNEICQETVPEAIIAFLEGKDFEDCIRNAISIGGDSDTLACITGTLAEVYYGVPVELKNKAYSYLDKNMINIIDEFYEVFV